MRRDRSMLKTPAQIAFFMMTALLVMAALFSRARLFGDTSFIAYSIIDTKRLAIQEHRYGSFITQAVLLLGAKSRLPLRVILTAYTLSFNVFYCAVCASLVFRFRQYGLAILMACFYSLFVTVSFYWPVNELNQAIAWMFLLFGVLLSWGERGKSFLILIPIFLVLAFLTIFTHFIVIIPLAFLWIYLVLDGSYWPFSSQRTLLLSGLLIALVAGKFLFVRSNSYDEESLMRIAHYSLRDVAHLAATPVIGLFLGRCVTLYWPAIIVFLLGLYSLSRQRRTWLAAWTIAALFGYFLIMGLTYGTWDKDARLFHMETEWNCASIIVAAPFVFGFLPTLKAKHAIWLLVLIFGTRLAYIGYASGIMSRRLDYINAVQSKMRAGHIAKLAIIETADIRHDFQLTWSVPYETLLMNAMDGVKPQPVISFIYDQPDKIAAAMAAKGFYTDFGVVRPEELDKTWFSIDSTTGYKVMKIEDVLK